MMKTVIMMKKNLMDQLMSNSSGSYDTDEDSEDDSEAAI